MLQVKNQEPKMPPPSLNLPAGRQGYSGQARTKNQISTYPSKDFWCLFWKVVVKEKLQNSNWFT